VNVKVTDRPLISIALPVYNGANYVRQALESIRAQIFTDFELIVSDNASTDETPEICREYARQDKRIRIHRNSQFLPQAENVNRAVDLCSGEWVKLVCHDDLMMPDCLTKIWEFATKSPLRLGLIGNGEQWLFGNDYRYPQEDDVSAPRIWDGRTLVRSCLTNKVTPPLPSLTTATVRKSAWQSSRKFDTRFAHFDAFLWFSLLADWDYGFIPQILTVNRIHRDQVAVSARKTMRSIEDHRLYWREFVRSSGKVLGLSPVEKLMARLRPLATAGSVVAIEVIRGDTTGAISSFVQTPPSWWIVLPPFVIRSYYQEKRKITKLIQHVPTCELYP
jgi:glycosyltransferase involved in cell wall biosynthesis